MSHLHERKEKNCLNCGTEVIGRYCHVCGQENIEPKETVAHLASHFISDLTHFDNKAFFTWRALVRKPGFLSKEYINGRRASYLHPVRLYFFTSAIFFLIFFSFLHHSDQLPGQVNINGKTLDEVSAMDSASFANYTANINKQDHKSAVPMTREEFKNYVDSLMTGGGIHFTGTRYKSKAEYDSLLATGVKKHNWLQRQLVYKEIEVNEKYHDNPRQILGAISSSLSHSLPQMLFISLPFFALILRLLYIRHRQYYYVSHFIFSVHLYIFLFLAMLFALSLSTLNHELHWGILKFLTTAIYLSMVLYVYLALKKFYMQGWAKTLMKFLFLLILFFIIVGILFVIMFFFSFFKI